MCFNKLTPWLYEKVGLHDTCGVHNLHGLPGIIGGSIGAIAAAAANTTVYGDQLSSIFPALQDGRSQSSQGGYQVLCLFCTLAISITSGLLTGLIIRSPFFMGPSDTDCFDDEKYWHMEDSEYPTEKIITQMKNGKQKLH